MRISDDERECAALLCAIAASNDFGIVNAASWLGDYNGSKLALEAQAAACRRIGLDAMRENYGYTYAEAEALLRTGWSP